MSIKSKVGTAAVIMAMFFASIGCTEDAPAALNLATTCAEGEVPDGLGNCVACDTCVKYPDSPYCALCGNPGKITKTTDQWWKIVLGVGVSALVIAALAAVLWYNLWYKKRHDGEQQRDQGNQGALVRIQDDPEIQDNHVRDGEAIQAPAGPPVTVRAEQETGADGTEPSIPIQAEDDDAGFGHLAETTPSSGQQLQPSDEQMPLMAHDDNAATVPK